MEFGRFAQLMYMSKRRDFRGVVADQLDYPRSVRMVAEMLHMVNHGLQEEIEAIYKNIRNGVYNEEEIREASSRLDVLKSRLHNGALKIKKCNKMLADKVYSCDEDDDLDWVFGDMDWLTEDKDGKDPSGFSISYLDPYFNRIEVAYAEDVIGRLNAKLDELTDEARYFEDFDLNTLVRYKRLRREIDKLYEDLRTLKDAPDKAEDVIVFWQEVEALDTEELYWGIYRSQDQFYKNSTSLEPLYEKEFELSACGEMDRVFNDAKSYKGNPESLFSEYLMTKYKAYIETGAYEEIGLDEIKEVMQNE